MGVQGLWELLAPVGRRVSVETLSGKKLAIDASIWMIQFMKAMRDERGEMVRNAHILGFFRRICKLLFLRTKAVFVFDGGTPALKRRTVAARRRQRENARAKIRKTAEKLLLNHLKSKRLEELAEDIKRIKSDVKDNLKGKQVTSVDGGSLGLGKASSSGQRSEGFDKAINQERLDELLAASIFAEEEANLAPNEPVPTEDANYEEEYEEEEEEEMIFPVNTGNIDPAALASLPPSMQLDLLDQMRERLMADNRQKYQKIKKVPLKFSELQIQSYLKTVAFRREIDEVQKCASGRGFGGLQTSRIASEANREYIFSSSFTGDKQKLTSTSAEKIHEIAKKEMKTTASDTSKQKLFMSPSKSNSDGNSGGELSHDVQTYLDDRGRVRVSRVRGLGIRMTRDLQRNLDLMKEHEKLFVNKISEPTSCNDASDFLEAQSQTDDVLIHSLVNNKNSPSISEPLASKGIHEEIRRNTGKSTTVPVSEAAIEISFSEEEIGSKTMVDKFFMNLVSDIPTTELVSDSISLEKKMEDFESEDIWEDGMVGEQILSLKGGDNQSSFVESKGCEEDEVMWEEGTSLVPHSAESDNAVSLGFLEEEADLKEAIRRSLEDIKPKQSSSVISVQATKRTNFEDQNSLISDNPCKTACSLVADGPILDKTDDRTLENYPNIGFENPYSRLDTGVVNAPSNSVTFLSTCTSGIGPSISSSSSAMLGIDLSKINSTEKRAIIVDVYQNFTEGSNFIDKPSMQEEDKITTSEANLNDEISLLKQERAFLGDEQRKLECNAESVSSEMFVECQELLQMFGLPYIIAPMEAEAQCAYMEMANLVDGIVTDDSDVFLFGARNVYKNIFDDRKYVETYYMKDIENELGLSRDKLIRMALLLGSDYTEGVSGIGIVNAIEVINGFPEKDGLLKFKEWVESPDLSILHGSQYSGNLNKRTSNTSGNAADGMEANTVCSASKESVLGGVQLSDNTIPDTKNKVIFMDKHRNVSKNWQFPPSFPSESVIAAYISPQIDDSTDPFAWGKPDLPLLRKLCWEKFGWSNQKADDLLVPVLKEYNKHETQLRMEAFYSFNERFAKIRSQRIKKAVKDITGISSSGLADIVDGGTSSHKKRGITLCNNEQSQLENVADSPTTNENKSSMKSRKNAPKRTSSHVSAESSKGGAVSIERAQIVNSRVRGKGKVVGRGRDKLKEGDQLNEKMMESSDDEMHRSSMKLDFMPEMRRSTRHRRQVNYAEESSEINELPVPDKVTNEVALEHTEIVMKGTTFGNDPDSVEVKMSQDRLHSGDCFCPEENEIQVEEQPLRATIRRKCSFEPNDGESQWPPDDENNSKFFVNAGGFCMVESDSGVPAANEGFQGELNEANFHEKAPKSNLGTSGQGHSAKLHGEFAHENLQLPQNFSREHTKGGGAAQNFFSAMPSLKRKRKN